MLSCNGVVNRLGSVLNTKLAAATVERDADDLARYIEAVERAGKLDEKIERTDALIDQIVYDLYGLTDEEIEIPEEAVADD